MSDDFLFYLVPNAMRRADLNALTRRVSNRFGTNKHDKHVIRFVKNTSINLFGHYILRFELFISTLVSFLGQKCGSQDYWIGNNKNGLNHRALAAKEPDVQDMPDTLDKKDQVISNR
jgi:hypothetical protein